MLKAEINNRLFIRNLPRKWTWDEHVQVACVLWEDGEVYAFAGKELTEVAYTIPDLLAIDTLEEELEVAGIPIKAIYRKILCGK